VIAGSEKNMKLEYGLDERVPFLKNILFGLQWAAILISIIIILGKIIGVLHFADQSAQVIYLQKLLFLSALTIICQIFWGHRLPLIAGPSAILLVGVIGSQGFEMSTIYSSVMTGGLLIFILAVSGLFGYLQRLFTSNVVAVVLLLITFTLAPTMRDLMVDIKSGIPPLENMGFALALIFLMFLFYRILSGIWRATLIIWAMVAGSFLYYIILPASLDHGLSYDMPWFNIFFRQMNFELSIQPGVLISFLFCSIALSINDLGSMEAVNEIMEPADREIRVKRGISLTGLANIVSGLFGIIGPVDYALSPGVIASTKCASRFTLIPTAAITLILSFLPAATGFLGSVPSVVIGAILAYTMTSQVAYGLTVAVKGARSEGILFENGLVIGLSVLLGTIVAFLPAQVVNTFPGFLRPILGNGFVAGVVSALILEHIIFRKQRSPE